MVEAIERFVDEGKGLTRDIGGTATTAEVGKLVESLI